jgi:addiction module RelE/StbE family toxin
MQLGLLIKEEALEDIQKAFDYYNEKSPKLGNRFLDTLDYYFERISKFPEHYQIRRKPYREAFIKDFPFLIIYEIEDQLIIVYAVFNTHKNPLQKPTKR